MPLSSNGMLLESERRTCGHLARMRHFCDLMCVRLGACVVKRQALTAVKDLVRVAFELQRALTPEREEEPPVAILVKSAAEAVRRRMR